MDADSLGLAGIKLPVKRSKLEMCDAPQILARSALRR
jgi:hypothetical protein